MRQLIYRIMYISLIVLTIISCRNGADNKKVEPAGSEQITKEITEKLPVNTSVKEHPGKVVFMNYCADCHQADGTGVQGLHPPLGPGSWVGKDPKELIAILMKGLNGKIEVAGEFYNDFMPSQAQLTDEEMADVLSYVRSSFGNSFEAVTVDLVKKIRSGK